MNTNEEILAADFKSILKDTMKKSKSILLKPLNLIIITPLIAIWENFVLNVCDKDSKQNLKYFNVKEIF